MKADNPATEKRRLALCDWLTANSISPNDVPLNSTLSISTTTGGQSLLHYEAFVRDPDTGNILVTEDGQDAQRENRTTPCTVPPPSWLRIPGAGQ